MSLSKAHTSAKTANPAKLLNTGKTYPAYPAST